MCLRYYKCSKYTEHFCPGTIKKLSNGSIQTLKPYRNHEQENNSRQMIDIFKNVLKARAISGNDILKNIYDEESRR